MAQPNFPVHKQSLNEALEQAYELADAEKYRRKIVVGPLDAYPGEELVSTIRPFSLEDGDIVIYQFPSTVHDELSSCLVEFCVQKLNSVLTPSHRSYPFSRRSAEFKGISDPLNCSVLKGKQPDAAIRSGDLVAKRKTEPIAVEVAYRNEYFVELLQEGCHILSQNSETLYVFLVFLIENTGQTDIMGIRLTVLERAYPLPSGAVDQSDLKCLKPFWPLTTPCTNIGRDELLRLPAILIYDRTIWRNEEISKDESVKLNLLSMNDWYGVPLFGRRFVRINVGELMKGLFNRVDVVKERGLYPEKSK